MVVFSLLSVKMRYVRRVETLAPVQMRPKILTSAEGNRMTVPAFEEYVPAIDCICAGCAAQRRTAASALPVRYGGHPAAHGARRALVLATAAGAQYLSLIHI